MAPLALLAAVVAVGLVVSSTTGDGEGASSTTNRSGERQTTTAERRTRTGRTRERSEPRTYRVRSGDTLGMIAEKTGIPVQQLIELNPEIDPQSLNVGDRVRLRR
jgi:LysM repeat protein